MVKGFSKKKIESNKSLGQRLKTEREKRNISLEEAEKETKVRLKYLKSLENGCYAEIPESVYVIGFVKKYADLLGIDSKEASSLCKQEIGINNHISSALSKNGQSNKIISRNKIKETRFLITPKLIALIISSLTIAAIIAYIWFSVSGLLSSPQLEIFYPNDQTRTSQEIIIVEGKTEQTAKLSINDQEVILDQDGKFNQEVQLHKGLNIIKIIAQNRINKQTEKNITILAE